MKSTLRDIELLAPARDAEIAIEAVRHGADAVYMGPQSFGARAMAGNSTADIARAVDFAHRFNAKVYATVNTIIYENELKAVEKLITDLYNIQVDALIVQDMSILRMDIPPIALHSSTQCDLRTPEKARFLASMGFSQLVMARELTLAEIANIHQAVPTVPLEGFVHGALCVSYSGRCQVSQALKGRSANRGECAQICRLAFDLEDEKGSKLLRNKHLLSLRDFNAGAHVAQMMVAGVSSFKIEGRLKDAVYVKNVVAHYRRLIDDIIAMHPDVYRRASAGTSIYSFTPELFKSFNRSFTSYFITGRRLANGQTMASLNTPKALGEKLGKVIASRGKEVTIDTVHRIANGDGLSYFNSKGEYAGFRVNKVEGRTVVLKNAVNLSVGTVLYRTGDKAFDDLLAKPSAQRHIALNATLRYIAGRLVLHLADERGNEVTHSIECPQLQPANTPQENRQREVLGKLGNTIYRLAEAHVMGEHFVPSSVLTALRRETVDLLDRVQAITYKFAVRHKEQPDSPTFATRLTYADNVANHLAETVFRDHGAEVSEPAFEVKQPATDVPVMHTRYCLRRELGACRLAKGAKQLPDPLFLRNGVHRLRVECDCAACEMKIYIAPS